MDNGVSHPLEGGSVVELAESKGLIFSPEQKEEFLVGCVTPDLSQDKDAAHFYNEHRESGWRAPDLKYFRAAVEATGGWTPELLGVYTHLHADVLFFRKFVAWKLSDETIQSRDGNTVWENGDVYKRASLYKTYKANRAVPCRELEELVQLIWEAEPEEARLSELTLARDWKNRFLSFAIPPEEDCLLDPAMEEAVSQLRRFAHRAAEELAADEWFMTTLRKALGA